MSEEEKQAIETLKEINQAIKCRPYFSIPSDTKLFDIILNLIEKQQQEIEELNEKISKAIGYIEACKTTLGNYILTPDETEGLLNILREKKGDNDE